MTIAPGVSVARPANVPPELVIDYDFYAPAPNDVDTHLIWKKMQDGPRFFWTPRNGGHWVATRGADIKEIQLNHELFSYESVTIPRSSTPSLPIEIDPPEHGPLRAIISPLFAPATLNQVEARARELTRSLIEGFKGRGRCEFQADFAEHLPIHIFLFLLNLPIEDRENLLMWANDRMRSPFAEKRDAAKAGILNYLKDVVAERRKTPGNDFISRIIHGKVGERPLTDDELQNMLITIMGGGLDTVASMLGYIMRFLANHPEHRAQLVKEPKLIPQAVDELIRRHGIVNTARVVTKDAEFHGIHLRKGERMQLPNGLYGLDADIYADPMTVDFQRPNAAMHAAFGNGPHRCPGVNMARLEIRVVLEEWLARIPNFEVDPDDKPTFGCGQVSTLLRLPLRWAV